MESLKLSPSVKAFKDENDSNTLTLGLSLRDSITKVWPELERLSDICAVTPLRKSFSWGTHANKNQWQKANLAGASVNACSLLRLHAHVGLRPLALQPLLPESFTMHPSVGGAGFCTSYLRTGLTTCCQVMRGFSLLSSFFIRVFYLRRYRSAGFKRRGQQPLS